MKELVAVLCRGLGVAEADLQVEESSHEDSVTVTVTLPAAAVQALDGRDHRTAKAVRQVLSAAAAAQNKRFNLVARARD